MKLPQFGLGTNQVKLACWRILHPSQAQNNEESFYESLRILNDDIKKGEPNMDLTKSGKVPLAWVLILPSLLAIFLVILYPLGYNFWASFHEITIKNIGESPPFVGLKNFSLALRGEFWHSAFVNIVYPVGGTILSVLMGLSAALIVNEKIKGRRGFRAFFLLPYVIPLVCTALLWSFILDPGVGVGNWILTRAGIIDQGISFTSKSPFALLTLIFYSGWRYFPFSMLFLLAGLQAIPQSHYNAAKIDGAGMWDRFRHITLPSLKTPLYTILLIRFVWEFTKYADPFLLTGGAGGSKNLPILIYQRAFNMPMLFGSAAATAVIMFIPLAIAIWWGIGEVWEF